MTLDNANDEFDDELLSAYVDDELTAEERATVEERLRCDPEAARLVEELRVLSKSLQAMPREDGLIGAVRKCLGEALREGAPTLGQVAAQLGVSARTLQRQLHDRGVDFSGLVEDTRRRFAMQYLDDRANTLTDVAFLLGYSEVSAFNRAFKRWTGSTPSGYRRRRQTLGAWRARTTKVRSSSRDRPGYH